ncbi:hypothetical protein pphageT12_07 [Pseudomonas phage pphageT12]|nr:hypothetical protein pphageB21_07 [Pseudomonas phage pphageB21]UAW53699.1 hypothetical protein pphageT21_07 [Pseudomonas phage pphageT21]UAW53758.1 hypothetical protein pphageT12_07 [Pseudomonas phage pphageT12]UAW53819.1 hypothetical protein pphageBV72_07 [Pseudomonas phage pphageBV72]
MYSTQHGNTATNSPTLDGTNRRVCTTLITRPC